MNLRKRAISGIMLAGSMVVMCAIADAASTVSAESSKSIFQNRDFHDSGGFKNTSLQF